MISKRVIKELRGVVGEENVLTDPAELLAYESDGYWFHRAAPEIVVLPRSAEEVVKVVRIFVREGIPFTPRGAGTGLSGGALAVKGGAVISLTKMDRILEVDYRNRIAVVEAGVVNQSLVDLISQKGYTYAPDPGSQKACTIGGNVAENAGGMHTLKYGVTVNHVLGLEVVTPEGDLIWLGGKEVDRPGYDLVGIFVGSEGTFGIATKAVLRIIRKPQSYRTVVGIFDEIKAATEAVVSIIAEGVVPAAVELMDNMVIRSLEEAFGIGFPKDAKALILIEVDGLEAGIDGYLSKVRKCLEDSGSREVRVARDAKERDALWNCRKKAFGTVGKLSPNYFTQDSVIPRTKLPEMLKRVQEIGEEYGLPIANCFHAGDGNLHPCILFDERDAEQVRRVKEASRLILEACVELGGSITGEHGIGVEKPQFMPLIFSPDDLFVMLKLREAFNPNGLCNPGKVLPEEV
jgi:glycolate oxidase